MNYSKLSSNLNLTYIGHTLQSSKVMRYYVWSGGSIKFKVHCMNTVKSAYACLLYISMKPEENLIDLLLVSVIANGLIENSASSETSCPMIPFHVWSMKNKFWHFIKTTIQDFE